MVVVDARVAVLKKRQVAYEAKLIEKMLSKATTEGYETNDG